MFSLSVIREITAAATDADIEPASLLAVAEVESAGNVFAIVDGAEEPLIRFEAHYFDRRLSGDRRTNARKLGLASPVAGTIANPPTQAGRWQLLRQAASIDKNAAYESVSWGLGQVMGAHWAWLGYASVDALVADARSGATGQIMLMVRFIEKSGLASALRTHDWQAFALGYNGPSYKKSAYHLKIADAYHRYSSDQSTGAPATVQPAVLRRGAYGKAIVDLQHSLTAHGYPVDADGIFGGATLAATTRFQSDHGLRADGIVGKKTRTALHTSRPAQSTIIRFFSFLVLLIKKFSSRM